LQALEQSRAQVDAATTAAAKAEKAVASLEIDIPKAEMEVKAQQQRANDLQERLAELRSNTQVSGLPSQNKGYLSCSIPLSPAFKSSSHNSRCKCD
jgi:ribosome maturation protein Sdo1